MICGSGNGISNQTKAQISGGTITSSGDLTVSALDDATITADAGGVAFVFTREAESSDVRLVALKA